MFIKVAIGGGGSFLRLISIRYPFGIFPPPFLERPIPLNTLYLRGNSGIEQGVEVPEVAGSSPVVPANLFNPLPR